MRRQRAHSALKVAALAFRVNLGTRNKQDETRARACTHVKTCVDSPQKTLPLKTVHAAAASKKMRCTAGSGVARAYLVCLIRIKTRTRTCMHAKMWAHVALEAICFVCPQFPYFTSWPHLNGIFCGVCAYL
jgi:hypothetical protein